jgi:hypothetical protein
MSSLFESYDLAGQQLPNRIVMAPMTRASVQDALPPGEVNHASYHCGWVVLMYFEIPAMPPVTDLPVYLRETDPTSFQSINVPTVEPPCVGQFASATNVLPDRYR